MIFFFLFYFFFILFFFFFFNDTATTEIYTLSLHDALPIPPTGWSRSFRPDCATPSESTRSEEHTSELQSRPHLVCRLLLEKKKNPKNPQTPQKKKKKNTTPNKTHQKK